MTNKELVSRIQRRERTTELIVIRREELARRRL